MRKWDLKFWTKKIRGSTLLEAMVATGLIAVTALGLSQFWGSSLKVQKRNKIKEAMYFLASDIENKLKSPSSIYFSILDAQNLDLIKCLLGTLTGCDLALTSFNPVNPRFNYFALKYATGRTTSATMTTVANGGFYDTDGIPCNQGAPNCIFQARTFFYASCDPLDGVTCLRGPAQIHVAYRVTQVVAMPDIGINLKPLPEGFHFYTHQVKDILGEFSQASCNAGAIIAGYDRRGYPVCRCSGVTRDSGLPPNRLGPICFNIDMTTFACNDPNLIFRGLKTDGTANCITAAAAYDCVTSATLGKYGDCPTGYFLREDRRTNCTYYCTIPKEDTTLECNSDEPPNDVRDSAGQRAIMGGNPVYIQQGLNNALEQNDYRTNMNNRFRIGLVCGSRTYTCCRPSGN